MPGSCGVGAVAESRNHCGRKRRTNQTGKRQFAQQSSHVHSLSRIDSHQSGKGISSKKRYVLRSEGGAKKQATFISLAPLFCSMWMQPCGKSTAHPSCTGSTTPSIIPLPEP